MLDTHPVCPYNFCKGFVQSLSQILTEQSTLPDIIKFEHGLISIDLTQLLWPYNLWISYAVSSSQI
jgi:hypothetical protein